ncbi:MAG: hypothetical protein JNK38_22895 [Acidobacteria bacterium]|nr:hypothetical protein [Acidobacteriota bacterium]
MLVHQVNQTLRHLQLQIQLTKDAKVEQTCADRSYGASPSAPSVAEIRRRPTLREALIEGRLTGSSLIEIYKADHDTGRTHVKS